MWRSNFFLYSAFCPMVPYCTVNLVRKHMGRKSICKWALETAEKEIVPASFEDWFVISSGSDISSLGEVLTARMRAKKCSIHPLSMAVLTWFEPTAELDTLMALMCTHLPCYVPRCHREGEDGRSRRNAWFLLHAWESGGDHMLVKDGIKSLRALLSLSNMLSFISYRQTTNQCLFMTVAGSNHRNVNGLKWKALASHTTVPSCAGYRIIIISTTTKEGTM